MDTVKSIQKGSRKRKVSNRSKRYKVDFKLRMVKLFLEESTPGSLICRESGISSETLHRWVRLYRSRGERGLQNRRRGGGVFVCAFSGAWPWHLARTILLFSQFYDDHPSLRSEKWGNPE